MPACRIKDPGGNSGVSSCFQFCCQRSKAKLSPEVCVQLKRVHRRKNKDRQEETEANENRNTAPPGDQDLVYWWETQNVLNVQKQQLYL